MKRILMFSFLTLGVLTLVAAGAAKNTEANYKFAEVKPFTIADGVQFPPDNVNSKDHLDSLYSHFSDALVKQKVVEQVVAAGGTIPDADAADSIVIEGTITDFAKNGRNMAHPPELTLRIDIYRRSDHSLITSLTPKFKLAWETCTNQKYFGNAVGIWATQEIKKALK
jgi:hypothetical protein